MEDLNYEVFNSRAYGDTWEELSSEDVDAATLAMMNMTQEELNKYDEYLWDDSNDIIIDEAIKYAVGNRYNPSGKFGYPFLSEKKICCLCGKEFTGWGNNAWPIDDGHCCDECNAEKVIPERAILMYARKETI